jgi:hypothetical protein
MEACQPSKTRPLNISTPDSFSPVGRNSPLFAPGFGGTSSGIHGGASISLCLGERRYYCVFSAIFRDFLRAKPEPGWCADEPSAESWHSCCWECSQTNLAMASVRKYSGPTLTRGKGLACAVLRIRPAPGFFCGGFSRHPARPIKTSAKHLPSRSRTKMAVLDPSASFAGLCVDCLNRTTCLYAKTNGGVWRCEEYR